MTASKTLHRPLCFQPAAFDLDQHQGAPPPGILLAVFEYVALILVQ
jgi:hypothetical protein